MKMVGISTHDLQYYYGDRRALEIAKQIGADAVDLSTSAAPLFDYREKNSVYSKSEDEILSYYDGLRRYADELGLVISQTHGRLRGFRKDEAENEAVAKNARLDCLVAHTMGAPICVMHSVATGIVGPQTPPEEMRELNFRWFSAALEFAKQYNVKIASETFGDSPKYKVCDFFGQIDEFITSFDRVAAVGDNARYFTTCVDTGHSNKAMRFGNPTPADVIRRLGKRVEALHLNDNDTLTDQHKIPMTGCIDWMDVLDALDEIDYQGVYNMELNLEHFGADFMIETAEFSVKVMRQMLRARG